MTETEKMLRGMLYDPAHDGALQAEMAACKALCRQFNQLAYQTADIGPAQALLRRLLGSAGSSRPSGATTAGTSPWAGTST